MKNFCPKKNLRIKMFFLSEKKWKVSIARSEKKGKNCQISIFGFKCGAINIRDGLKICTPYI
jgi:hypothetical protein